ncbi:MAG: aminoglycoside phosphotransferase, partial [Gammaproteobacteria bacterium]
CYISWPEDRIEQFLKPYYQQLIQAKLIDCAYNQFKRDFDLMGIQRHLKAIGIFSRLNIRDGKSVYLGDIPRTLDYVINVSQRYPELEDFHSFLVETVLPLKK